MNLLKEELLEYCEKHTNPQSKILDEIERHTNLKVLRPRMLSGFMQGKLLSFFVDMIKPENILEIGTYTAFSSIAMAETLDEDSKIVTIENNYELEDLIRGFIKEANFENKIKLIMGNAIDEIKKIDTIFDLAFIDADKQNYSEYFKLILPLMKKGSYIIADNVLWSGKVLDPTAKQDEDTKAICEFNKMITENKKLDNIILPFRDGLNIIKVK